MLKIFKVLLLTVFVSQNVLADDSSFLKSKLDNYQSMQSDFNQVVTKKDGSILSKTSGTLALAKPNNLMLHTLDPDEQVLFTKGSDVYFYDPFVNQVSIYDKGQLYTSPFLLLTSKNEKVWNQYQVTKDNDNYTIVPKSKGVVTQIKLSFASDNISSIEITMNDGNTNHYELSNLKYNISNSVFNYDIPSDAQVDDERKSN